jgi:hypothetical protein
MAICFLHRSLALGLVFAPLMSSRLWYLYACALLIRRLIVHGAALLQGQDAQRCLIKKQPLTYNQSLVRNSSPPPNHPRLLSRSWFTISTIMLCRRWMFSFFCALTKTAGWFSRAIQLFSNSCRVMVGVPKSSSGAW